VSIAFTSSWTDATGASAASTGAAVTVDGAATEGAALDALGAATGEATEATEAATGAAAFFEALAAGTTGAAATGTSSVFLVTFLVTLVAGAELIIPDAVEVFMAGIRTYWPARIQFWVKGFRPRSGFWLHPNFFLSPVMIATGNSRIPKSFIFPTKISFPSCQQRRHAPGMREYQKS